jgi:hypothetical protein
MPFWVNKEAIIMSESVYCPYVRPVHVEHPKSEILAHDGKPVLGFFAQTWSFPNSIPSAGEREEIFWETSARIFRACGTIKTATLRY